MKYEFTIIVPVYNEKDNLKRVEKELSNYLKIASKKTNILFVNDGSKDNSHLLIEEICANKFAVPILQWHHPISFLTGTLLLVFISSNRKWEIYELAFSVIFLLIFIKLFNKEIYTANA